MRRSAILGVAALIAAVTAQPLAAQDETSTPGSLRVTIQRPDGAPVSLEARLEVHDGTEIVHRDTVTSDAAGNALFESLPAGARFHARVVTDFEGAMYSSEVVNLASLDAETTLTVYPVTTEGRPLHVDTMHIIIQAQSPGSLQILQFLNVSNNGAAAYAGGPSLRDGRRAGLVIPLPPDALNVRPAPFPTESEAIRLDVAQVDSDRVLDARPVPPVGRQVAVTYDLESAAGTYDVVLGLPYPVASLNIMVGGPMAEAIVVDGDLLSAEPQALIGEEPYAQWSATALQPGQDLRFRIGPPGLSIGPTRWALLGLGLALAGAVAASFLGGHAEPWSRRRNELVRSVAEIDHRHERGELDDESYLHARSQAIEALALIEAQLERAQRAG